MVAGSGSWEPRPDPQNFYPVELLNRVDGEVGTVFRYTFAKGHATGNDFIIIDDPHGMHELTPEVVAGLCDRHRGVGADGVLRVVRAGQVAGHDFDPELWFMDYRNADGSLAEMCGNGLRLFARYLLNDQFVQSSEFEVATRAGLKQVRVARGGMISANLGFVGLKGPAVRIRHEGKDYQGQPADVGNPHAVVVTDADTLANLDLTKAPTWDPLDAFPAGVNIEFIHEVAPGQVQMRVFERGCGETLSCGTGVVASAVVHRSRTGHDGPVEVSVPGGGLTVTFESDGAWLTGPAVIVARGEYWT